MIAYPKHAAPSLRPGAAGRLRAFRRAKVCVKTKKSNEHLSINQCTNGYVGCLGSKRHPETTLKSLEWVPKSIRVIARTPCEHRSCTMRLWVAICHSSSCYVLTFLAAPGRSKGRFGIQKSTWGGKVGTFRDQCWPKGSSKRGSKMGSKK